LLGVLAALTALGMDTFLPSLPVLARAFAAQPAAAQLAVTTYLLGLALGQLVWGPVSDRFGRKPVLLAGLALFLATSIACALAGSVEAVILVRLLQGFAISSGPVVARSIVRDLYAREQAAQLLSRMAAVFSLIPMLAPLIGAQSVTLWGWQAVFWFFSGTAALLLAAVAFGLQETVPAARPSIAPRRIVAGFAELLRDARFRGALATMLCAQLGIIAFVSASAVAMTQAFSLSPGGYAMAFSLVMVGQICGSLAGGRLVSRLGMARMVRVGAGLALAGGALLASLALASVAHWSAIVLPMIVYIFGCAFILPNALAAALSPFPHMAGSASSLLGALPFGLGALVSALLAAAFDGSTRPMALVIALFGVFVFLSEKMLFRKASHG
jgi:DHA1 family bicyclomycin/chloramphenicol resistance-like MFS transporter